MQPIFPKRLCYLIILACLSLQTVKVHAQSTDTSNLPMLPIVIFKASVFLSPQAKIVLDTAAKVIKRHPGCNIIVAGNSEPCELCQQVAWDRVYSVITYLKQKGISKDRLIFSYDTKGTPREVWLTATTEKGPSTLSPPMPCYSYHKLTKHRCADYPTDGSVKPKL